MSRYDAYIFDVQGTLMDFYTPVFDALANFFGSEENSVPIGDLVRAWRRDYFSRVASLDQSAAHWSPVQDAYTAGLDAVSKALNVPIDPAHHAELAQAWKRLTPWPDVPEGLQKIRQDAVAATLSNTDMSTMVQLSRTHQLEWDAVLTAEVFGAFKPEPFVYERTCRYLGVEPGQAAMVASHPYDLRAARAVGLATVFVYRPYEFGCIDDAVNDAEGEFDHWVDDIRSIP
ncbi:haloacid dehalogenase type II [Rhodococcus sovatensis]|uniref:Haloacid dehalogenase type II n=1 Tax=Rhodococcus sovatensis TaxID=1805840 RepID=A0ABZ2PIE1_9NOCA